MKIQNIHEFPSCYVIYKPFFKNDLIKNSPLNSKNEWFHSSIFDTVVTPSGALLTMAESKEPTPLDSRPASLAETRKYRTFSTADLKRLPQLERFSPSQRHAMEVVARVLPFKANNYVVEDLIDWDDPADPIFKLTFPQKGMLKPHHFDQMAEAYDTGDQKRIAETANEIRQQLNPHPAGQKTHNVPHLADGTPLEGMQHKYRQTVLYFASQGQTCHAYCSFCFRWPQFVALDGQKFAMKEANALVQYLREHDEVTDVLFTGGDPMIMKSRIFSVYLDAVLEANLPHIQTIRIGTKAISYWPYRFTTDNDAADMLNLLRKVPAAGKQLAIMAHVNHPNEIDTPVAREAISRIRETGAIIRSQSPLMRHINDDADTWARMWSMQMKLGIVPYYMFVARDTGAQHYFSIPLVQAAQIYARAARQVSGLGRTVRGPSMSCTPGKVEVNGVVRVNGKRVIALRMLQGRNPDWAYQPFFAEYDPDATWLDELRPAFGEDKFFFERDSEWGTVFESSAADQSNDYSDYVVT